MPNHDKKTHKEHYSSDDEMRLSQVLDDDNDSLVDSETEIPLSQVLEHDFGLTHDDINSKDSEISEEIKPSTTRQEPAPFPPRLYPPRLYPPRLSPPQIPAEPKPITIAAQIPTDSDHDSDTEITVVTGNTPTLASRQRFRSFFDDTPPFALGLINHKDLYDTSSAETTSTSSSSSSLVTATDSEVNDTDDDDIPLSEALKICESDAATDTDTDTDDGNMVSLHDFIQKMETEYTQTKPSQEIEDSADDCDVKSLDSFPEPVGSEQYRVKGQYSPPNESTKHSISPISGPYAQTQHIKPTSLNLTTSLYQQPESRTKLFDAKKIQSTLNGLKRSFSNILQSAWFSKSKR